MIPAFEFLILPIDLSFEELKDFDLEILCMKLLVSILIFGTYSSAFYFASA